MRQTLGLARPILVILLAGTVALAPAGAAHAKKHKRCHRHGSTTILRSGKVRVYEVGRLKRTVFGCVLRTGQRTAIAAYTSCDCSTADEPQPTIWLKREAVAVNSYFCPPDGSPCTGDVASYDLRRRARQYREDVPGAVISDLVLKPNASFAYIAGDTVRKADADGISQLDPGPEIATGSLARAGSTIYWTRAGQPYSATLR